MASFATEGESVADLFRQPDFWKSSELSDTPPPLAKDFFDLVLKDGRVKPSSPPVRNEGFFKPPSDLNGGSKFEPPSVGLSGNIDDVSMDDVNSEPDEDLWMNHDVAPVDSPQFKTWDGFELSQSNLRLRSFITEAGASAYDAFLASKGDQIGLQPSKSCPILEPRGFVACLLALSLGRESILFAWTPGKKVFVATLELVKIPGYSAGSLLGITRLCSWCGEAYRRLQAFVDKTYTTNATPSRVALANALDRLLLVVQDELGARGIQTRSVLQLQSLVRPVYALLSYLQRLISKIKRSTTDSALLSLVYTEAQSAELSEPFLRNTMGELLRMVSKPWTDLVEEWVGLKKEEGIPITKDGPGKGFVRVDDSMWVDDQGFELAEPDYFLDMDNMPTFVPDELAQAIFETGRNLRFIKSYHPQNPLSSHSAIAAAKAPSLEWEYDWESITRVEQKALDFHRAVSETLRKSRAMAKDAHQHVPDKLTLDNKTVLQFFGKDVASLEESVLASMALLDQPVQKPEPWDKISKIVRNQLFKIRDGSVTVGTEFSPHWSLIPLVSFGPLIYAQARLVNRECLRLLFLEHNLREHLRLQRAFQLLGNGVFSSHLTNALFNPDMDATERQAGIGRSGGNMGLRLASRDNWPPASSELRLALMGVLQDSYVTGWKKTTSSTTEPTELPGDLSFAIRDLTPEEVEACMDPDSLEALDFLRMSYKPPSPLFPIMTPAILVKYDKIFKLLLRVLRMLFVIDQLFRDVSSAVSHWANVDNASLRFRIEAHHFVSNVARYFFDTGIEKPWHDFEVWLDKIEKNLAEKSDATVHSSTVSPDRLGERHERALDEIMTALLLKKRQQPILKLLEEIFALILRFAKKARLRAEGIEVPDQETKDLYKPFREKVEVFVTVCRGMTEKAGYGQKRDGAGGRAAENPIVMLLLMLDMSNYFAKR
ncbi:hypothetical protein N0V93_007501 [Gnomoniopsis smithogilvyi]|uniref:Spindle pole body component n=1 Tax=Gnomoniopsis smithogilvyi TaxID=1191159 RepID=A0A9W8YTS8_9PEZI|nr:hypothetical protein N0V93_007501 [Gnomoniopsis smithogilvyi]